MIGYIEGKVLASEVNKLIVLTASGLGHEVTSTIIALPGEFVKLYATSIYREDQQSLYGFRDLAEKKLFETLLDVNGVGPKSAFNLIATVGNQQIFQAIQLQRPELLKAPGVGKKTAEQLVLSLKDKLTTLSVSAPTLSRSPQPQQAKSAFIGETLDACFGLGFQEKEILPILNRLVEQTSFSSSEDLLKSVLKEIRS
jgi:Holliday junction DNA helicase RuvA